jgi:hypothetical protein
MRFTQAIKFRHSSGVAPAIICFHVKEIRRLRTLNKPDIFTGRLLHEHDHRSWTTHIISLILKLSRLHTYLAILASVILICLLYQCIWIFSRTTTAKIYAVSNTKGRNNISWIEASYQVGYETYYGSFLKDGYDISNRNFKIRYLVFDPDLARSDSFASNWGPLIMFFILVFLVTSIVFIRKDIVSEQAIFIFQTRRPFISVQNNVIEDYDKHDISNVTPDETKQALIIKSAGEEIASSRTGIKASVYQYNPNAIAVMIAYIFYFFWFFRFIFIGSFGYPVIFITGAILIFVPLYVQNTRNPVFKMKIPDEGSLIFSSRGLIYKNEKFYLENIESAVVYLESFRGFEYRDRISTGKTNTISDGDNNKISVRYKGDVMDFTFILNSASDYWAFKKLMGDWSVKGVNVFMQKVFEDEFVIQEETHFHS